MYAKNFICKKDGDDERISIASEELIYPEQRGMNEVYRKDSVRLI